MSHSPWTLNGPNATLAAPGMQGRIDLNRPDLGLNDIVFQGRAVTDSLALGVILPDSGTGSVPRLADHYVRGSDLVATYSPTANHPLRIQIYWRLAPASQVPPDAIGIDLVVSAQTHLLDASAQILAATELGTTQIWRLTGADRPMLETLEVAPGSDLALRPAQGPGCLLFRSAPLELSYLEMIHAADFHLDTVMAAPGTASGAVRLVHQLFQQQLEKGVILRSRIRGVWLPSADETAPVSCYAAFSNADLPLTT